MGRAHPRSHEPTVRPWWQSIIRPAALTARKTLTLPVPSAPRRPRVANCSPGQVTDTPAPTATPSVTVRETPPRRAHQARTRRAPSAEDGSRLNAHRATLRKGSVPPLVPR